jgi:hypothetical protein
MLVCRKPNGLMVLRESCRGREAPVDLAALGASGPEGPPGPAGPPGDPGPSSALVGARDQATTFSGTTDTRVLTVALPAGRYVVAGKGTLWNPPNDTASHGIRCALVVSCDGTEAVAGARLDLADLALADGYFDSVSWSVAHELAAPGLAALNCRRTTPTGADATLINSVRIVATQVGELTAAP